MKKETWESLGQTYSSIIPRVICVCVCAHIYYYVCYNKLNHVPQVDLISSCFACVWFQYRLLVAASHIHMYSCAIYWVPVLQQL